MKRRLLMRSLRWTGVLLILVTLTGVIIVNTQTGSKWLIGLALSDLNELQVEGLTGTLATVIYAEKITWEDADSRIELNQVDIDHDLLAILFKTIRINQLSVREVQYVLKQTAELEPSDSVETTVSGFEMPVKLDLESVTIHQLMIYPSGVDSIAPQIFNDTSVSLTADSDEFSQISISRFTTHAGLNGTEGELSLTGELNTRQLNASLYTDSRIQTSNQAMSSQGSIEITPQNLSVDQTVQLTGLLDGQFDLKAHLNYQHSELELSLISSNVRLDTQSHDVYDFSEIEIQMSGPFDTLNFTLSTAVTLPDSLIHQLEDSDDNTPLNQSMSITASGVLSGDDLQVNHYEVNTGVGSLSGQFTVYEHGEIVMNHRLLDFNPQLPMMLASVASPTVSLPQWTGRLNGQIVASVKDPGTDSIQVMLEQLALEGVLNDQAFTASASGHYDAHQLVIRNALVEHGSDRLTVNAVVESQHVTGDVNLQIDDIAHYHPNASGSVQLSSTLSGSISQPVVEFDLASADVRYDEISVDELGVHGEITVDIDQPQNSSVDLTIESTNLAVLNRDINTVDVSIQGSLDSHNMQIQLDSRYLGSELSVSGGFESQTWRGDVDSLLLSDHHSSESWTLTEPMPMVASSARIQPGKFCLQSDVSASRVCADFSPDDGPDSETFQIAIELLQFDVGLINRWLHEALTVDGVLNNVITITLSTEYEIISAAIDMRSDAMSLTLMEEGETVTTPITLSGTKIHVTDDAISANINLSLNEDGHIRGQIESSVNGQINGSMDLDLSNVHYLSAFSAEVADVSGAVEGRIAFSGDWQAPDITLQLDHTNGWVVLSRSGTRLVNNRLILGMDRNRRIRGSLQSGDEDSFLIVEGQGVLEAEKPWYLNGTLKGQHFQLVQLPDIELQVSPDIAWALGIEQLQLNGSVAVDESRIAFRELPQSAVTQSGDVLIQGDTGQISVPTRFDVEYDIDARLLEPLDFNALGLKAEIEGGLTIQGQSGRPTRAMGRLNVNNGVYKLYGQTLEIADGSMNFNGPLSNPTLDVKASRPSTTGAEQAGIELTGPADRLSTRLTSEPVMSDLDALSILVTGRRASTIESSEKDDLSDAVLLLGLRNSAGLLAQLQSELGVDVLTLRNGRTGEGSALEAGKYIGENLYVGYAFGIFNRAGILLLNYQINKRLSLESEYGQRQSVDLIYRVEKRE